MEYFKIGQIENNSFCCWRVCETFKEVIEFSNYVVNNTVTPEAFIVIDGTGKKAVKLLDICKYYN